MEGNTEHGDEPQQAGHRAEHGPGAGDDDGDRQQRDGPGEEKGQVQVRRGVPQREVIGQGLEVRGGIRNRIGLVLDIAAVCCGADQLLHCDEHRTEEESAGQDRSVQSVHASTVPLTPPDVVGPPDRLDAAADPSTSSRGTTRIIRGSLPGGARQR